MSWYIGPFIAGASALSLIAGVSPAVAGQPADPQPVTSVDLGLAQETELPVEAIDVTRTDEDLGSTRNEVSVIAADGSGTPTVTKLRTDSPEDAAELAAELSSEPGVLAAPTKRLRAFGAVNPEPMAAKQWNLAMVGAPAAWSVSKGAGVVVAVVDTGVDATHPDLAGRVLREIDLLPKINATPEQTGHGTGVASLIAGALNGVGMAGVAPQASILPVSALDPAGQGDTSTVARAIIAAADAGARVINLSLGGPGRDPVLDKACTYAFSKGAVVVAAAGNSYQWGNEVQYPAASPNVLGVASVDRTGNPSYFSNTGPHIDLAAPGEAIWAATPGGRYGLESGTSFAAPHVSGALALVLAANPRLTSAQASAAVKTTAVDDISGNGRDDQLGQGILRADRAVAAAKSASTSSAKPAAYTNLRLERFNARPEPAKRGRTSEFVVRVQARFVDRGWRVQHAPTLVRFEFKKSGSRTYKLMARVKSATNGWAVLRAVPPQNGRWRARVQKPNGYWKTSRTDYLKVRR
ncbi:MAG: S8 family serine peptidase [Candidatus Nanopelagicales bacterium]